MKTFSLRPNDDGMIQIFQDGRYVGYIENDKLFGFNKAGYAEEIATLSWSGEAGAKLGEWLRQH